MEDKSEEYKKIINAALRASGKEHKGLAIHVDMLAKNLAVRDTAFFIIQRGGITQTVTSSYGERQQQDPAVGIFFRAQEDATKILKQLGLNAEDIDMTSEDHPIIELTKKVKAAQDKAVKIMPDE